MIRVVQKDHWDHIRVGRDEGRGGETWGADMSQYPTIDKDRTRQAGAGSGSNRVIQPRPQHRMGG